MNLNLIPQKQFDKLHHEPMYFEKLSRALLNSRDFLTTILTNRKGESRVGRVLLGATISAGSNHCREADDHFRKIHGLELTNFCQARLYYRLAILFKMAVVLKRMFYGKHSCFH